MESGFTTILGNWTSIYSKKTLGNILHSLKGLQKKKQISIKNETNWQTLL